MGGVNVNLHIIKKILRPIERGTANSFGMRYIIFVAPNIHFHRPSADYRKLQN